MRQKVKVQPIDKKKSLPIKVDFFVKYKFYFSIVNSISIGCEKLYAVGSVGRKLY